MNKFGLLTVLEWEPHGRPRYALCRCDCGREKRVRGDHLRRGKIISCGCERTRLSSARAAHMRAGNTRHGQSGTRAHNIWLSMKQRCLNPKSPAFKDYGGRGIGIAERWLDFSAFFDDMGHPGPGETLDRINNDGGYSAENCRWATRREQQNNRRINRNLTHEGETMTLAEWSRRSGVHRNTLDLRLASGLSAKDALDPAPRIDLSGLVLGAAVSQASRKERTHCSHGHEWTDENTYWYRGNRSCRACHNNRERARHLAGA